MCSPQWTRAGSSPHTPNCSPRTWAVRLAKSIRPDALVHFVLPYYNIALFDAATKTKSKVVSLFTHREEAPSEENKIKACDLAAEQSDLRIAMNKASAATLSDRGPTTCIRLPILPANVGNVKPKKYRIGVSYSRMGRDVRVSTF